MSEIEGKNVIITGAASGIGLEYVKELLKCGASQIAIFDVNAEIGEEVTQGLNSEFGKDKVIFKKVDVTNAKCFEESFRDTVEKFQKLDIFINNAGIADDSRWELEININVTAAFRGILLGLKYMSRDEGYDGGIIVNVSSIVGLMPYAAMPGYVATKHAILGASMSFGDEYNYNRTGVKVLTVCPGPTETPLMRNMSKSHCLGPAYEELAKKMETIIYFQNTKTVAKGLMEIIQKAKTRTVWVIEDDQSPYEIDFQTYKERRKV